jgi:hypothetical protein
MIMRIKTITSPILLNAILAIHLVLFAQVLLQHVRHVTLHSRYLVLSVFNHALLEHILMPLLVYPVHLSVSHATQLVA